MNNKKIKEKNIKNLFLGEFFEILAGTLLSFFLAYYLKERGLSILEIGGIFTIALGIGVFSFTLFFSKILRKIKLKTALVSSAFLSFLRIFILFIFPGIFGAITTQFMNTINNMIGPVARDVSFQHNTNKDNKREVVTKSLIIEGISLSLGLILSFYLVKYFGFSIAILCFSFLAFPSIYFFNKVSDKNRFNSSKMLKLPKVSLKLKIFLFLELIYWFALASSFVLVITFLVTEKFSGGMGWLAILFGLLYLSMSLSAYIFENIFGKKNLVFTSFIGMFLLLASALLILFSQNLYTISLAFILEGIGAGIWVPSKTAILWGLTSPANRERVSGWFFGFKQITGIFGPLFGGFLVSVFGFVAPFYFKAGICLIILLSYFYFIKK